MADVRHPGEELEVIRSHENSRLKRHLFVNLKTQLGSMEFIFRLPVKALPLKLPVV